MRLLKNSLAVGGQFWQCAVQTHALSTSSCVCAGKAWRLRQGMAATGYEYGPLTEIPDWSYADGRAAPLNRREVERRDNRKQLAVKVVEMVEEINFAKENYKRKQNDIEEHKRKLLNQKLKPRRGTPS